MTTVVRSRESTSSARAHRLLAHRVEVRRRLVQDQDRRVLQEGARDGHALALAARELRAALAHDGVEPVGQRGHEVVERGLLDRRRELLRAGPRPREQDVAAAACR